MAQEETVHCQLYLSAYTNSDIALSSTIPRDLLINSLVEDRHPVHLLHKQEAINIIMDHDGCEDGCELHCEDLP